MNTHVYDNDTTQWGVDQIWVDLRPLFIRVIIQAVSVAECVTECLTITAWFDFTYANLNGFASIYTADLNSGHDFMRLFTLERHILR